MSRAFPAPPRRLTGLAAALAAALSAVLSVVLWAGPAPAGENREAAAAGATVVATRSIRARTVLGPADLTLESGDTPGAVASIEDAVGLEARRALYAGRPVMAGDLGPPAVVERNEIVTLVYRRGALSITTEGRALGRGGVGDRVRVSNLDSRNTVTGVVIGSGMVEAR